MIGRTLGLTLAAALWIAPLAQAAERFVVINGARMAAQDLLILDTLAGEPVPDGRYWLDTTSGAWGYEGGPAQGVLGLEEEVEASSAAGAPKRYYEDYVDDFCARHGGC
jgi:hypothetical protein